MLLDLDHHITEEILVALIKLVHCVKSAEILSHPSCWNTFCILFPAFVGQATYGTFNICPQSSTSLDFPFCRNSLVFFPLMSQFDMMHCNFPCNKYHTLTVFSYNCNLRHRQKLFCVQNNLIVLIRPLSEPLPDSGNISQPSPQYYKRSDCSYFPPFRNSSVLMSNSVIFCLFMFIIDPLGCDLPSMKTINLALPVPPVRRKKTGPPNHHRQVQSS